MTPEEQRAQMLAAALKDRKPLASLDPTSPWYGTLDEAAQAAFARMTKGSSEQAGAFFKNPAGQFAYSIPVPGSEEHFALRVQPNKEAMLAGLYHQHLGADQTAQYFSPNDLDVAQQLKVPSYVQFMNDGAIRSYTPGKTPTQQMNYSGTRLTTAHGDEVKRQLLATALEQQP